MAELAKRLKAKFPNDFYGWSDDEIEQGALEKYPESVKYKEWASETSRIAAQNSLAARAEAPKPVAQAVAAEPEEPAEPKEEVPTTFLGGVRAGVKQSIGDAFTPVTTVLKPVAKAIERQFDMGEDGGYAGFNKAIGLESPSTAAESDLSAIQSDTDRRRLARALAKAVDERAPGTIGGGGLYGDRGTANVFESMPLEKLQGMTLYMPRAQEIMSEEKANRDSVAESDRQKVAAEIRRVNSFSVTDEQRGELLEQGLQRVQRKTYGNDHAEAFRFGRNAAAKTMSETNDPKAAMAAAQEATVAYYRTLLQATKGRELGDRASQNTATYEQFIKTLSDPQEFGRMALQTGIPMAIALGTGAGGAAMAARVVAQFYGTAATTGLLQAVYDGKVDPADVILESFGELVEIPGADLIRGAGKVAGKGVTGALANAGATAARTGLSTAIEGGTEAAQTAGTEYLKTGRVISGPEALSAGALGGMIGAGAPTILGGIESVLQRPAPIAPRGQAAFDFAPGVPEQLGIEGVDLRLREPPMENLAPPGGFQVPEDAQNKPEAAKGAEDPAVRRAKGIGTRIGEVVGKGVAYARAHPYDIASTFFGGLAGSAVGGLAGGSIGAWGGRQIGRQLGKAGGSAVDAERAAEAAAQNKPVAAVGAGDKAVQPPTTEEELRALISQATQGPTAVPDELAQRAGVAPLEAVEEEGPLARFIDASIRGDAVAGTDPVQMEMFGQQPQQQLGLFDQPTGPSDTTPPTEPGPPPPTPTVEPGPPGQLGLVESRFAGVQDRSAGKLPVEIPQRSIPPAAQGMVERAFDRHGPSGAIELAQQLGMSEEDAAGLVAQIADETDSGERVPTSEPVNQFAETTEPPAAPEAPAPTAPAPDVRPGGPAVVTDSMNQLDILEQMLKAATAEEARNKSVEPAIPDEMKRQIELADKAKSRQAEREKEPGYDERKARLQASPEYQTAYNDPAIKDLPDKTKRAIAYKAAEAAEKSAKSKEDGDSLEGALSASIVEKPEAAAAAPTKRPGPTRKKGLRDLVERAVEFVEESPVQRLLNKATDSLEASAAQGLLDKATERIENERPRPMERPRAGTPTPLEAGRVYKVGDQLPDGKYVSDVDAKGRVSGVSKDKPTNNEEEIGGQVYGDDTSSKATVSDSIRPKTHEQSRARLSEQGQRALDRAENLIRTASDQYTKLLARIVGFGTSILHYGGSRAPERFSGYTYHPQGVKGSEQAVWVNDLRGAARRATSHKKFVDSVVETFRHELDEHTGGLVHGRGIKQDADGTYYVNSDGVKVYMSEDASEKGSTGAVARGREGHPDEFSTQVQSGVAKNSPELNNAAERLRTALMNTPEIYYDLKGGEEGTSDTARAGRRESAQYEKGVKMATDVGEEIGGRKLSGIVNPESYEGNIDGWWEHNQNLGFSEEQIAEALQEYSASKLDSELGGQEIPKAPVAEQYAKIREQTTRVPPTEDNVFRAGQASKEMGRLTYLAREAEGNAAKATQSVPKKDRGENLENLPATVKVDGRSRTYGAFKPAQDAAKDYAENHGIDYEPQRRYVEVDKERAKRIADEYEKMKHDPENPEVKAAYAAMIKETLDQYEAILKTGLKVEFIPAGKDPYPNPRAAIDDVVNNNHMWVFPTEGGFGTSEEFTATGNPLLAPTEHEISGKTATANDIFRVVHDYFGHIKEGVGFRASGEENAWRSHSAMYSPLARRAMTTETRGQNSWLNFGPHGEKNRTAKTADTVFADQKTGLLPEWVSEEGARDTDDYDIGGQRLESGEIGTVALLNSGESADPGSKTLREAFKELKGDDITDLPEDRQAKAIADKMLPEMRHQKKQVNSGIGWYKTDIEAMEHALKSPQPELNDSEEMLVMKMIAAATSFGQDPNTNIESALTIYRDFKESGQLAERQESGKSWPGKPGFGINAKKFTRMAQELGGMKAVAKWMAEKHPLSEIKEFNPNVKVQGKATDMQYGSYVLGPKGGPFFQNLIGNRDLVTGDRWDNRAMHRLMGTPISDMATPSQRAIFNKAAEIVAKKLDVDPADLQAMRWFFEKSVYEALGVKKASFGTYSVAGRRAVEGVPLKGSVTARSQIQEESKSIATEVKFGTDSPYGRKYNWSSLTPEQQRKVTYAHGKYLIEAVEAASGVKVERADPGKGVYEGDANPNWVIKAKGTPQQIESASALFGLGSQQDSVIASREVGPGEGKVGLDVSSKTKGTDWARPDFIEKVWAEYKRIAPDLAANAGASLEFGDGGVSIRMFNDGFADKGTLTLAAAAMQNAIRSVDPKASPEVSPKEFQVNSYRNNWSESASGEAYRETLRARGFADAEIDRFIEGADASLGKAWRRVNPQDQNIGGQMAPGGPGRVRTSTKGTLESLENARRARKPVKGVLEYLVDKRPRIASPAKPRAPLEDLIKG